MNNSTVEARMLEYARLVNRALPEYLPKAKGAYRSVCEAMSYSALAGGKRLRPLLMMEFYSICAGADSQVSDVLPFACAVEMIHTYSLIHDDLPCMDNDDLRRGRPSCHVQFGEATALLAGDALLSLAFETALCDNYRGAFSAQNVLSAVSVLAKASGVHGMVGGQVIDLESEGKEVGIETLEIMHSKKTGAMIIAPAKMGCILADATDEQISAAAGYAQKIGLAFQIVDDILDYTGDNSKLGKPVGSDSGNKKSTYVTHFGLERSRQLVRQLTAEAIDCLRIFGDRGNFLAELAWYLTGRDR